MLAAASKVVTGTGGVGNEVGWDERSRSGTPSAENTASSTPAPGGAAALAEEFSREVIILVQENGSGREWHGGTQPPHTTTHTCTTMNPLPLCLPSPSVSLSL